MKPQDCFGVVIRTIGLLGILMAIFYAFSAIYIAIDPSYSKPHSAPKTYIIISLVFALVSLYLLRGATHLIQFCYPKKKQFTRNDV